ncbi:MAG TPA: hypothetical protein VGO00_28240 [Kofleriaceae bacterium]|nr:hypothetical protein [Kofleriaceae bacterium]
MQRTLTIDPKEKNIMNTTEPKNSASNVERDLHTKAADLKNQVASKIEVPKVIVNASRTSAAFVRDHWLPIALGAVGVAAIAVTWSFLRRR